MRIKMLEELASKNEEHNDKNVGDRRNGRKRPNKIDYLMNMSTGRIPKEPPMCMIEHLTIKGRLRDDD